MSPELASASLELARVEGNGAVFPCPLNLLFSPSDLLCLLLCPSPSHGVNLQVKAL